MPCARYINATIRRQPLQVFASLAALIALLPAGLRAAESDVTQATALLEAGNAPEAIVLFEQALVANPESVAARLGLGRAYYALGEYARALIEFESVLDFDNLPPDLIGQTEAYDRTAAKYAADRRWRAFHYAETGIGGYRENSSGSTELTGGAGDYDTFLPLRVGGGWNASVTERYSFNGTLDYRFRTYDEADRRNDSDLRWNLNFSRPLGAGSLRFGTRGRVSYRGNGQYRNDLGAFADYRLGLGSNDQLQLTGEFSERRYARDPLRQNTRASRSIDGIWTHAFKGGRTSLSLGAGLAHEWATRGRPDGDGNFWGVNGSFDHAFSEALDAFFWWSYVNEAYDDERPDAGAGLLPLRNDDLWNIGTGVVWNMAPGWSLRPTVEYNWEDSNIDELAYSSTEFWLTFRKSF